MTEITIKLDPERYAPPAGAHVAKHLRENGWEDLADQIEAQLPQPVPTEPTGDSLVEAFADIFRRGDANHWYAQRGNASYLWADLVAECDRNQEPRPVIYDRRVGTEPAGEDARSWDERPEESGRLAEWERELLEMKPATTAEPMIPASKVREVLLEIRASADNSVMSAAFNGGLNGAAKRVARLLEESAQ